MADQKKVGAEVGQSYPSPGGRKFMLHFQQNRRKELVLKGRTLMIEPYGTAQVSEEELQSPEFQSQAHFFAVTEVK